MAFNCLKKIRKYVNVFFQNFVETILLKKKNREEKSVLKIIFFFYEIFLSGKKLVGKIYKL